MFADDATAKKRQDWLPKLKPEHLARILRLAERNGHRPNDILSMMPADKALAARLRIWWLVRSAAARWTPHLRNQRRRELKIFVAGAMAMLTFVVAFGALTSP
jgi:hypothetical protein